MRPKMERRYSGWQRVAIYVLIGLALTASHGVTWTIGRGSGIRAMTRPLAGQRMGQPVNHFRTFMCQAPEDPGWTPCRTDTPPFFTQAGKPARWISIVDSTAVHWDLWSGPPPNP